MGSMALSLAVSFFVIDTRNIKGFHRLHNDRPLGPFGEDEAYEMAKKLNDFVYRNRLNDDGLTWSGEPFRVICDWTEQTR